MENVMKTIASFAFITALSSTAFAQSAPAAAPAPAPTPAAAPSVVVVNTTPAAEARLQLSTEDQELILDGEIGPVAHIGGGLVATFVGFGTGQMVQGRWLERGWIFTVGETAGLGVMVYGLGKAATSCVNEDGSDCGSSGLGLIAGGAIAVTGLHIWEIVDAFVAPIGHNRRVRAAKLHANGHSGIASVTPYVAPAQAGNGTVGGLALTF
jgi:hypothetical protein